MDFAPPFPFLFILLWRIQLSLFNLLSPFFPKKKKRKKKKEIRSICLTPETLNVSANEDGHALSPAGKRRRRWAQSDGSGHEEERRAIECPDIRLQMDGAALRNARFASNKRIDLARDEAAVSSTSHRWSK